MVKVNPKDIILYAIEVPPTTDREVRGGDWDITEKDFNTESIVVAFQHLHDGGKLSETEYCKRNLQRVKDGMNRWGCTSELAWNARMSMLAALYCEIRDDGFKVPNENDMVGINIDRKGRVMFNNGRHRLAIAKVLGLESIPVRINLVHKNWDRFKKDIKSFAKTANQGKIYQAMNHPDLQDIPYHWGNERLDAIKSVMQVEGGTCLDIGANWGQYSEGFARMGFDVLASENNTRWLFYLERLRDASPSHYKVYSGDVLFIVPTFFDVVIALNIFHHFIKTERVYNNFKAFLGRLQSQEMYFQAHNPEEPQMRGAYRNFAPDEFAQWIVDNSCYTAWEKTDYESQNRPIYRIYK